MGKIQHVHSHSRPSGDIGPVWGNPYWAVFKGIGALWRAHINGLHIGPRAVGFGQPNK